ncbi:AAA family ATPase [Paraliomyxa miuraensis]|uniref:AAA family ATPase n=1 Tax=Paraliomyxa miuraensis TaxID=376150 RepID=UPI0022594EA5|nr:AAA family ATPase [Paraliomyxa miuraensis]MCX4239818.1 endonuclease NucS [Paraliomyxa miuraensis]
MRPSFNIAGPCIPGEHYMLPPERRLGHVLRLVDERRYFTLHAGRQVGKTTCARWMVDHHNAGDRFCALWVDVQDARELPDPARAFELVLDDLDRAVMSDLPDLAPPSGPARALEPARSAIHRYLGDLAARAPRPLVVLFDEADGLVGETMVSFLTQLRQGYIARGKRPFPSSVALVGQRQVRDYVLREEDRRAVAWLGTTSPFNVTAEAATLDVFTQAEVGELVEQHTEATGQCFARAAIARIHELGQGHPWLTNALADQIVRRDVTDRGVEVTAAHVDAAKEAIILERRTHIDSLVARLREERVRRIIAPMLVGDRATGDVLDDDFAYVLGLGLIREHDGHYELANPIYREVLPRALTHTQQLQIGNEPAWYVRPDGSLDMPKVMADWQLFWREDGHLAAAGFRYREAGPHLMLMAFLQRIVNGGGTVVREYGLGRGALDLLVDWRGQRHAIEVKIRRDTVTEQRALDQVARYLDHLGLAEGWMVLFDPREALSWEERLYAREVEHAGKRVRIVGC